jgi:hypothetical protein
MNDAIMLDELQLEQLIDLELVDKIVINVPEHVWAEVQQTLIGCIVDEMPSDLIYLLSLGKRIRRCLCGGRKFFR